MVISTAQVGRGRGLAVARRDTLGVEPSQGRVAARLWTIGLIESIIPVECIGGAVDLGFGPEVEFGQSHHPQGIALLRRAAVPVERLGQVAADTVPGVLDDIVMTNLNLRLGIAKLRLAVARSPAPGRNRGTEEAKSEKQQANHAANLGTTCRRASRERPRPYIPRSILY